MKSVDNPICGNLWKNKKQIMTCEIIIFGASVLREKTKEIKTVTPEIKDLAARMLAKLREVEGLGLAAPQIGESLALCVVDVPEELQGAGFVELNAPVKMPLVMLNPTISETEGSLRRQEGCLSFPGLFMDVTRPRACTVEYMAPDGQHYRARVYGLLARAVMHEVDHLNGVLFIDKFSTAQKMLSAGKLRRIKSEQ